MYGALFISANKHFGAKVNGIGPILVIQIYYIHDSKNIPYTPALLAWHGGHGYSYTIGWLVDVPAILASSGRSYVTSFGYYPPESPLLCLSSSTFFLLISLPTIPFDSVSYIWLSYYHLYLSHNLSTLWQ